MDFTIKKGKNKFNITVFDDLTATINDIPAHFDVKYNAVILDGNKELPDLIDENGMQVNGLRIEQDKVSKILKANEVFKKEYDKLFKQQKTYTPTSVKYINNRFIYDNIGNTHVTTSDTIEKLNLLVANDDKLNDKILKMVNDEGYIQTSDLVKLPEYIEYVKEIKKYEKMQKEHLKLKEEFDNLIQDKIGVGLTECNSCNELTIIGGINRKFLPKVTFFEARTDWLGLNTNKNRFKAFCLGITDQFYFVKVGNTDQCNFCKVD